MGSALEARPSLRRARDQAGHQRDQGRLAAAREAHDGDELALRDLEIDAAQHLTVCGCDPPVALRLTPSSSKKATIATTPVAGHRGVEAHQATSGSAIIMRSSRKPIRPIVNTATMICASVWLLPFWNMSQTNFPRPGFWASISAAISTIQPTPSESRSPVKISGSAEGMMILNTRSQGPELEDARHVQVVRVHARHAESAVFTSVGQSEQSATVIAELMKDFSKNGILRGVERAHQDHHDGQPGQRRHRLEDLDQRD